MVFFPLAVFVFVYSICFVDILIQPCGCVSTGSMSSTKLTLHKHNSTVGAEADAMLAEQTNTSVLWLKFEIWNWDKSNILEEGRTRLLVQLWDLHCQHSIFLLNTLLRSSFKADKRILAIPHIVTLTSF